MQLIKRQEDRRLLYEPASRTDEVEGLARRMGAAHILVIKLDRYPQLESRNNRDKRI